MLTVADSGIGISPADAAHVFDRYWQAHTRRKGRQGIGLGLVIVRGIVEAHGGRVWVESEIGKGSQFHFTVPMWRNQIEE
jgi:signal transduction histidine kinase